MKILSPGRKVNPTVLRGTCDDCGCSVECDHSEPGVFMLGAPGDKKKTGSVACPNKGCSSRIALFEHEIHMR